VLSHELLGLPTRRAESVSGSAFSVEILPFRTWLDGFEGVRMLGNFSALDSVEIVIGPPKSPFSPTSTKLPSPSTL
jgi:hypothetical protein